MGTEDSKVVAVQLGSYAPDAVIGKATNLSPDQMNMRYDLYSGIKTVLGNTAYNTNQCAGAYGLGGDTYQYIRKDGTFDEVLSRVRAEGKIYQVTAVGATQTNIINSLAGWGAGQPSGGGNLWLYSGNDHLEQFMIGGTFQLVDSVMTNPGFETGDFTGWTCGAAWSVTSGPAEQGTYFATRTGSGTVLSLDVLSSTDVVLLTYLPSVHSGWTQYTIPSTDLVPYQGTYIKIRFKINGANTLVSDAFFYTADSINFYYIYDIVGGNSTVSIDNFQPAFPAQTVIATYNYGVTPTTFGNLSVNCTIPSATSILFEGSSSADNITYGTWIPLTTLSSSGIATLPITTTITLNPYFQVRYTPNISNDDVPTISNVIVGGQWVSSIQNLGGVPASYGVFTAVTVLAGNTPVYEINTSLDGTVWDGWTTISSGDTFTGTLRQFLMYRVSFDGVYTAVTAYVTSLSLDYQMSSIGGSLVELTGFAGSGFNQYFGVLNNLLVISDSTSLPYTWSGRPATSLTEISGGPLGGTYPVVHCNRYFLAYSPSFPSRIWWSDIDDPTTWDLATQFIDLNPDDGDHISGIASYGGILYVFKHKHPYEVQGNDFDPTNGNFSDQPMPQMPGCESHNSIKIGSDGQLYYYSAQGVCQYNGSSVPTFIGRGFIDNTVKSFKQNLNNYNQVSACDNVPYSEMWFAFGHTIYTFNYAQNKWGRILFDNNLTGNTVYSLSSYIDPNYNTVMSFTGNNVLELWNDSSTFYIGSLPTPYTVPIQSYYMTDFLDGEWFYTKNCFKALLNVQQLSATIFYLSHYLDFSTIPIETYAVACPTSIAPDQYQRIDLASLDGRRMQFKLSSLSDQWGVSDMGIQGEISDMGRL